MRHKHPIAIFYSAAVAQMAQMHIWLSKYNGRHVCRIVQLTGWVPNIGAITGQPEGVVPCGEAIQTGPEGRWKTFTAAYHIM